MNYWIMCYDNGASPQPTKDLVNIKTYLQKKIIYRSFSGFSSDTAQLYSTA